MKVNFMLLFHLDSNMVVLKIMQRRYFSYALNKSCSAYQESTPPIFLSPNDFLEERFRPNSQRNQSNQK